MAVNIFFFIIIALILFFVWKGYNRGLVGIIFGIVAWIFAIYFIQTATPKIESYLMLNPKVVQTVSSHVEKRLEEKADVAEVATGELGPVEKMKELISQNEALSEFEQKTEALFEEKKTEAVTESALAITANIIRAMATLAALVMAMVMISLAWTVVHFINHAPIVGKLSRFLGMLFGLCEGFFIVWILMYTISLIPASMLGRWAMPQIMENEFLLYLYNNNILRLFFG